MNDMQSARTVDGESLRTRMVRDRLGPGRYGDPYPHTDLRGAPVGDKVEIWEFDRLVYPRQSSKRRIREHVESARCREGWYCVSGAASKPMDGGATCHAVLFGGWLDRHAFNAFHADHPVIWRITIRTGAETRVLRYCDAELPDEYRPDSAPVARTALPLTLSAQRE